jgi:hypothetical protein
MAVVHKASKQNFNTSQYAVYAYSSLIPANMNITENKQFSIAKTAEK